jgi:predicted permease
VGDGQPSRLAWGELVSANYFEVMGVQPILGRVIGPSDAGEALGASPIVVISAGMWRNYFHSDPAIIGRTVRVNRHTLTIAGVVPAGFRGSSVVMQYDLWIPITMGVALGSLPQSAFAERGERGMLTAISRLRPGSTLEEARAEVLSLARGLAAENPKTNRLTSATLLRPWEEHNGINEYLRAPLVILLAVSFVLLLIVCVNVANLLLARSVARQREFGIRLAMGAGRYRVALQMLTETLLLAAAGAGVGLLLLLWVQGSLISMVPSIGFPVSTAFVLNSRILGFTALACLLAAVISGASPALFVFHSNLNEVLKEGSRSDTAGAASRRTRSVLVMGEVALATVALVGAGLFVRSFRNLRAVDPGFDSSRVLLGRFFIETAGYTGEQIEQFSLRLTARTLTAPGIESAAYTDFVPLSTTAGPFNFIRVEGYTPAKDEIPSASRALVSPAYFSTMRIPLLEGRPFDARDHRKAEPVMIVNQSFVERYFHGQSPLGRKVRAAGKVCTVVGVARNSKYYSPAEAPMPYFYLPFHQFYGGSPELYFLARSLADPVQTMPLLRSIVSQADPDAAGFHAVPLAEYTQVATFGQKVAANLMAALGLLCLLLAASGLYSVMAYSVSQRIPEIGIRMAMGARPRDVIAMIVGQGMALALAGMAAGIVGAFAATRLVSALLFRVDSTDPSTFLLAAAFLGVVALIATWLPAFRATRIDPMSALRR